MTVWIEKLGIFSLHAGHFWMELAAIFFSFWNRLLIQILRLRLRHREILDQMYKAGVESFPIILFALSFVGLMLVVEFSFHMKLVLRQDSLVPAFSTVLIMRELGPVITCLLLASRVAAGIAAEIGSMVVTEQIDAMKLLGVDPIDYLAVPRIIASVFACMALSIVAVGTSIAMGALFSSTGERTAAEFFSTMFTFVRFHDAYACLIKAAVFGFIFSTVAVSQGLRCERGSEGVGRAATKSVVHSSVLIIIADFLLTFWLYG